MKDFRLIISRVHAFNSKFLGSNGLWSPDRCYQGKIVHRGAILDEAHWNHWQCAEPLWRPPIRLDIGIAKQSSHQFSCLVIDYMADGFSVNTLNQSPCQGFPISDKRSHSPRVEHQMEHVAR